MFGALLLMNGIGVGMFAAPNTTGIMNSVPSDQRGVASGMRATFQNTGMVLSIGLFFSLMVVGLSSSLPSSMSTGLVTNRVPPATAQQIAEGRRMGDRPILFEIDPLEAVDIDEEPDFILAEALDRHFASKAAR